MAFPRGVDFERSRICWGFGSINSHGSFKIEAILRVYDASDFIEESFVLSAGVLAGNVYAPDKLVKQPAYNFQIAASSTRHVIFRTYTESKLFSWKSLVARGRERDSYGENQLFEPLDLKLHSKDVKKIESNEEIESHLLNCSDFTCLIHFPLLNNLRLELEFPVKHINFHPTSKEFQVETGPILFVCPEFFLKGKRDLLRELIPSFIHFSSLNRADFTLDFPYGARKSLRRGKFMIEEMDCNIQLWVSGNSLIF